MSCWCWRCWQHNQHDGAGRAAAGRYRRFLLSFLLLLLSLVVVLVTELRNGRIVLPTNLWRLRSSSGKSLSGGKGGRSNNNAATTTTSSSTRNKNNNNKKNTTSTKTKTTTSVVPLTCKNNTTNTNNLPITSPSFIIIGGMKCGTSSLRDIFQTISTTSAASSKIIQSIKDEPLYFSNQINNAIRNTKNGGGEDAITHNMNTLLTSLTTNETSAACQLRNRYMNKVYDMEMIDNALKQNEDRIWVYERSPGYIRTPGTAQIISRLFNNHNNNGGSSIILPAAEDSNNNGNIQIIAVLRDPVQRLYMEYAYLARKRPCVSKKSFEELIDNDIQLLRQVNLIARALPTLQQYTEQQQQVEAKGAGEDDGAFFGLGLDEERDGLTQQQQRLYRLFYNMMNDSSSTCGRNMIYNSMYSLQLREWLHYFQLGDNLMVVPYEKLRVNKTGTIQKVLQFLNIPSDAFLEKIQSEEQYQHYFDGNQNPPPPDSNKMPNNNTTMMSPITERYLRRFYKPYNDALADMLGEEWRGIWD